MPLVDYAGKEWKVIHVEGSSSCQEEDQVTFLVELDSNNVTISCGGKPTYKGTYDEGSNTITGDGYVIRMVQCIKLTPTTEGPIAGSWTAEDQGPWPGDG